jgi:hypothetical protein
MSQPPQPQTTNPMLIPAILIAVAVVFFIGNFFYKQQNSKTKRSMYGEDVATQDDLRDTGDDFGDLQDDEVLKTVYTDDPAPKNPQEKQKSSSPQKPQNTLNNSTQNNPPPNKPNTEDNPVPQKEKKEVVVVTTREQEREDRSWTKDKYNNSCSTGNRDLCMKSKIRSRCNSRHTGSDKRSARRGCRLLHKQYYKDSK